MTKKMARKVVRKIAQQEGIKESEVRKEMQIAIQLGFMNAGTRQKWDDLFGVGIIPDPEEFIVKMSNCMAK